MISAQKDGSKEMKLLKSYIVSSVMVGDEGSVRAKRGGGEALRIAQLSQQHGLKEFGAGWNLILFLEKCDVDLCWRGCTLKIIISEAANRII